MHLPFKQQSIASRVRTLAKQSNGRTSNTIANKLTMIWTPRLISIFQPTIKFDVPGLTFVSQFHERARLESGLHRILVAARVVSERGDETCNTFRCGKEL